MKTMGLIGGLTWESSIEYYRLVNEGVRARLGGLHSARLLLLLVRLRRDRAAPAPGRWADATRRMVEAAESLRRGGAEFLVICSNTMHRMADEIQAAVPLPLVHIADATALAVSRAGLRTVGLLGTRFTMEQDFYKGRLADRHGLTVLTPDEQDRTVVHDVIYDELCRGIVRETSREAYRRVVGSLVERGAGDRPRLHRDRPPAAAAGRGRAALRHHPPARRGGRRVRPRAGVGRALHDHLRPALVTKSRRSERESTACASQRVRVVLRPRARCHPCPPRSARRSGPSARESSRIRQVPIRTP